MLDMQNTCTLYLNSLMKIKNGTLDSCVIKLMCNLIRLTEFTNVLRLQSSNIKVHVQSSNVNIFFFQIWIEWEKFNKNQCKPFNYLRYLKKSYNTVISFTKFSMIKVSNRFVKMKETVYPKKYFSDQNKRSYKCEMFKVIKTRPF